MASRGPGVLSQGTIDNFFRGKSTKPFLNDPRPEVHSLEGSCDLDRQTSIRPQEASGDLPMYPPPDIRRVSNTADDFSRSPSPSNALKRKRDSIDCTLTVDKQARRPSMRTSEEREADTTKQRSRDSSSGSDISKPETTPPVSPPPVPSIVPTGRAVGKPINITSSSPTGTAREKAIMIHTSSPTPPASPAKSLIVQSSQSEENDSDEEGDTIVKVEPEPAGSEDAKGSSYISADDGADDSESSLEDLETLTHGHKDRTQQKPPMPLATPPTAGPSRAKRKGKFEGSYDLKEEYKLLFDENDQPRRTGSIAKRMANRAAVDPHGVSSPSVATPTPEFRVSLAKLVKQHKKSERGRAAMEEAEAAMRESEEPAENDTDLMAAFAEGEDDEEKLGKLAQAMARAEVLNTRMTWSFFDNNKAEVEEPVGPFPHLGAGDSESFGIFERRHHREQAFATGFMASMVDSLPLVPESAASLMKWLWSAALCAPSDDLAHSYLDTYKAAASKQANSQSVGESEIQPIFEKAGAKQTSLEVQTVMVPCRQLRSVAQYQRPRRLFRLLQMIKMLAEGLNRDAVTYILTMLGRLAADTEVTKHDIEVQLALQHAFTAVTAHLPEDIEGYDTLQNVSMNLYKTCQDTMLRQQMIAHLPCTTARLALFRRRLALAFFLSSPDPLNTNLHHQSSCNDIPKAILTYLDANEVFEIDVETDYTKLGAIMSILDAGIGPGFSPAPDLLSKPLPASRLSIGSSKRFSHLKDTELDPVTEAQRFHNKTCDSISDALSRKLARFNDRGASHMARTDAKGVIERLVLRLDLSVRCWPRKRGGRGGWVNDGPPRHTIDDRRQTLDAFVKPVVSDRPKKKDQDNAPATANNDTKIDVFGEEEFEARLGVHDP